GGRRESCRPVAAENQLRTLGVLLADVLVILRGEVAAEDVAAASLPGADVRGTAHEIRVPVTVARVTRGSSSGARRECHDPGTAGVRRRAVDGADPGGRAGIQWAEGAVQVARRDVAARRRGCAGRDGGADHRNKGRTEVLVRRLGV